MLLIFVKSFTFSELGRIAIQQQPLVQVFGNLTQLSLLSLSSSNQRASFRGQGKKEFFKYSSRV
jgi:hypothetical protein